MKEKIICIIEYFTYKKYFIRKIRFHVLSKNKNKNIIESNNKFLIKKKKNVKKNIQYDFQSIYQDIQN